MSGPACPRCGRTLTSRDPYCSGCGTRLRWVTTHTQAGAAPPRVAPPTSTQAAPPSTAPPARPPFFFFSRPRESDWAFWWFVLVMILTVIAVFTRDPLDVFSMFDVVLGLPINFVVFVLPVLVVRWLVVRARRRG